METKLGAVISPDGLMTVNDFLRLSRISRSTFYKEVRGGRIAIVKVGRRTLIQFSKYQHWLERLSEAEAPS